MGKTNVIAHSRNLPNGSQTQVQQHSRNQNNSAGLSEKEKEILAAQIKIAALEESEKLAEEKFDTKIRNMHGVKAYALREARKQQRQLTESQIQKQNDHIRSLSN